MTDHDHHHTEGEHANGGDLTEVPAADFLTAGFWDARYSTSDRLWSGHVNDALAEVTRDLVPGRALDAGCGEGGDALWLAERGWEVTGTDVSPVALSRAAAYAQEVGLADRTRWEQHDLLTWAPEPGSFHLVLASFVHLPSGTRREVYAALAASVAPGGGFVVLAHHYSDVGVVPRPDLPDLFFTPEELVADLDPEAWEVVMATVRPRVATHPEGHPVTVHDTVLHARRRTS